MKKIIFLLGIFALTSAFAQSNSHWQETLNATQAVYQRLGSDLDLNNEKLLGQAKYLKTYNKSTDHAHPLAYFIFPAKTFTKKNILWLGGTHPDEYMASYISWRLLIDLLENPTLLPQNYNLIYVPILNPDGWIHFSEERSYPTRTTSQGIDLNRSFYDRDRFPNSVAPNEVNFALDLINMFQPEFIVAPHSTLFILDLDGPKSKQHQTWVNRISRFTEFRGAEKIPVVDFHTYGDENKGKNWSLGKWVEVMAKKGQQMAELTFEFGGPGIHPGPNDPDRANKLSKRKHLGRYVNNTHLAAKAYEDYFPALMTALMSDVFTPLQ